MTEKEVSKLLWDACKYAEKVGIKNIEYPLWNHDGEMTFEVGSESNAIGVTILFVACPMDVEGKPYKGPRDKADFHILAHTFGKYIKNSEGEFYKDLLNDFIIGEFDQEFSTLDELRKTIDLYAKFSREAEVEKEIRASVTTQFQARSGLAHWDVYKYEPRFLDLPEEVVENLSDFESSKKYLKKVKEIEWDAGDKSGLNRNFLLKLLKEKLDQIMIQDMSLQEDGSELCISIAKEPVYMLVRKPN